MSDFMDLSDWKWWQKVLFLPILAIAFFFMSLC